MASQVPARDKSCKLKKEDITDIKQIPIAMKILSSKKKVKINAKSAFYADFSVFFQNRKTHV